MIEQLGLLSFHPLRRLSTLGRTADTKVSTGLPQQSLPLCMTVVVSGVVPCI